MNQDQAAPSERPRLQVITDEPSLEQRVGIVLLDGRELIRLGRSDLRRIMRDAEGVISRMDWYWADNFYGSDYGTNAVHLVHDEGEGNERDIESLKRAITLCGRKPYSADWMTTAPGWHLSSVVNEVSPTGLCERCLASYTRQREPQQWVAGIMERS